MSSMVYSREEGWWIVVMMALPPVASFLRVSTRCIAVVESRPAPQQLFTGCFARLQHTIAHAVCLFREGWLGAVHACLDVISRQMVGIKLKFLAFHFSKNKKYPLAELD